MKPRFPLGRIVDGGPPMLYTIRELPSGLFLYQRRPEYGWGHSAPGWTIHREQPGKGRPVESIGHGRTLREAIEKAKGIKP
jgi:hypothetical protein